MIYTYPYFSPLGPMTLASDGAALIGAWFNGQKYFPKRLSLDSKEEKIAVLEQTQTWLERYFQGRQPDFTLPLQLIDTPFRIAVWKILQEIPYGKVVTYKEIAEKMGNKMSAQAIGGAVGHNPISIIIPCHRVVGSNGSLTGYAGGIQRKLQLLTIEQADISRFFIPKL